MVHNVPSSLPFIWGLILVATLASCSDAPGRDTATDQIEYLENIDTFSTDSDSLEPGDSGSHSDTGGDTATGPEDRTPESICTDWNDLRSRNFDDSWTGSVAGCDPGSMNSAWRDRALEMLNFMRFLADLPAVSTTAVKNTASQGCALLLTALGDISHDVPPSTPCYTPERAEAAASGFVAGVPAVRAIDHYMIDYGASNASMIGHRRYMLANSLGPIGIGSTDDFSCMWALGGTGTAAAEWVAWPPPGPVPREALYPLGSDPWNADRNVDQVGWTVQSPTIDLASAAVSVEVDGVDHPVIQSNLDDLSIGNAIKFIPDGWSSQAGTTYRVTVHGTPIEYHVQIVDCADY